MAERSDRELRSGDRLGARRDPAKRPGGSAAPLLFEPNVPLPEGVRAPDEMPSESDRRGSPLRPVWIVLLLLVPCLILTIYYSQYGMSGSAQSDSLIPSANYAFVLLLINVDLIGLVVLTLLLSRNLIKAYFERRQRMLGAGFQTKLVAAFIGFSLIPTVLLGIVASGL